MKKRRLTTLITAAMTLAAPYAIAGDTPLNNHGHEDKAFIVDVDYIPTSGEYAPTVASTLYVEPSITRKLNDNERVSKLTERNKAGETIIQRLTDRTYWIQKTFYNTLAYVGDDGVLLMDPLGNGAGPAVLSAVKQITNKPITAVLYSHDHADHIGDISVFIEDAKDNGRELRIIASDATAAKMKALGSQLPAPTETVPFLGGEFQFEDLTVQAQGFERASHTDDSAGWLMVEEGIMHAPDMTNPDQMPYLGFGAAENAVYLPANLQQLADGDWRFFNGGHGNVGTKADIAFMQTYLSDMKAAIDQAYSMINVGDYFNAEMNNHEAAAHRFNQAFAKQVTTLLRPKYGKFYGFEASVPYQVEMVSHAMMSYR